MDLSKTFGCLRHQLSIAKLNAHVLTEEAVKLLASYNENRSKHIRLGTITSSQDRLVSYKLDPSTPMACYSVEVGLTVKY